MSDTPLRRRQYTPGPRDRALTWQAQTRDELWRLLHLDDLRDRSEPIAFEAEVEGEEERDGYVLRHLELNTTCSRRMAALFTLPVTGSTPVSPPSPVPAVVCIHGHGGDRSSVHDSGSIYIGLASTLASRGYATMAVDVGQHEVYEEGRILTGERLWDLVRCVDYLASLPEVDGGRIGCAGLSLGGEMAMWLGAMDERIAAEVSAGFLTTMDQMEQNHCMCWKFEGLRDLVDYADIYSLTAPRPLMCQNGLLEPETQFHVSLARQALAEILPIYRDMECPRHIVLHIHGGGHEIDLPPLLDFLDEHLGGRPTSYGETP